jgi:hypothetical protein
VHCGGIAILHILPVGVHKKIPSTINNPIIIFKLFPEPEIPHATHGSPLGLLQRLSSVQIILMPGLETTCYGFHHAMAEVVFLPGKGFLQQRNEEAEAYDQKEYKDDERGEHEIAEDAQKEVRVFRGVGGVFSMEPGCLHASRILSRRGFSPHSIGVLSVSFSKRGNALGVYGTRIPCTISGEAGSYSTHLFSYDGDKL